MIGFELNGMVFDWDDAKAASNLKKHNISFYEAASVFNDMRGILIPDEAHSHDENRFLLLGMSGESKLLTVIHVDHHERLRIMSARPATRRERRNYEQSGF